MIKKGNSRGKYSEDLALFIYVLLNHRHFLVLTSAELKQRFDVEFIFSCHREAFGVSLTVICINVYPYYQSKDGCLATKYALRTIVTTSRVQTLSPVALQDAWTRT